MKPPSWRPPASVVADILRTFVVVGVVAVVGWQIQVDGNRSQDNANAKAAAIVKVKAVKAAHVLYVNSLHACQRGNRKVYRPLSAYYDQLTSPPIRVGLPPGVAAAADIVDAKIQPVHCLALVKRP